jgi:hypothetical protein
VAAVLARAGIPPSKLGAARLAGLKEGQREFYLWILRCLASQGRPSRAQLHDVAARLCDEPEGTFARLARHDLVHLDSDGEIAVAYPFSGRPTAHRVRFPSGHETYAMCAIDALGSRRCSTKRSKSALSIRSPVLRFVPGSPPGARQPGSRTRLRSGPTSRLRAGRETRPLLTFLMIEGWLRPATTTSWPQAVEPLARASRNRLHADLTRFVDGAQELGFSARQASGIALQIVARLGAEMASSGTATSCRCPW